MFQESALRLTDKIIGNHLHVYDFAEYQLMHYEKLFTTEVFLSI